MAGLGVPSKPATTSTCLPSAGPRSEVGFSAFVTMQTNLIWWEGLRDAVSGARISNENAHKPQLAALLLRDKPCAPTVTGRSIRRPGSAWRRCRHNCMTGWPARRIEGMRSSACLAPVRKRLPETRSRRLPGKTRAAQSLHADRSAYQDGGCVAARPARARAGNSEYPTRQNAESPGDCRGFPFKPTEVDQKSRWMRRRPDQMPSVLTVAPDAAV